MNREKTYHENLEQLADIIKEEYLENSFDGDLSDIVFQNVDNALIYYADQYYVMDNTRNEDAYFDHVGSIENVESFQSVVGSCAYYALYEDLQEYIDQYRWESVKEYLQERKDRAA